MEFFTVTANFDMSAHSDLKVKSFKHWTNAYLFADSQRIEFLNCISGGELDWEDTEYEVNQERQKYFHYGVSKSGEDFVTIRITKTTFADDEVGLLGRNE
jgi:hypothetical protein